MTARKARSRDYLTPCRILNDEAGSPYYPYHQKKLSLYTADAREHQ